MCDFGKSNDSTAVERSSVKHVLVHGVAYVVAGCFFILATFLTGCQREPVKFYETSASRSDLKDWEGEVLARLDNLDHAHPTVEPAKTLRILAYPGLIHRSHAGRLARYGQRAEGWDMDSRFPQSQESTRSD